MVVYIYEKDMMTIWMIIMHHHEERIFILIIILLCTLCIKNN